jgi:exopolysaccharide biosynthesis polyprenyl glycosylphosphotransferase
MSSPALSEREAQYRRVPPASRLIPGLPYPQARAVRKKPQSVRWDRQCWVEDEPEHTSTTQSADAVSEMRRAILPAPAESGDGYYFVMQVAADFLLSALSLCAVILLPSLQTAPESLSLPFSRLATVLVYGALLTLLGHSEGLYRSDTTPEMKYVILGKVVAWAALLVAGALCASGILTLLVMTACAPLSYFTLRAWRSWQQRQAEEPSQVSCSVRNVLIIGAGKSGRALAARLAGDRAGRSVVRGFLDDDEPIAGDVLGRIEDLARIARAEFVDEVILTTHGQRDRAQHVIREAQRNRLDVKIVPDLFGVATQPVALEHFGDTPVLTIHEEPIPGAGLLVKRALDIGLSAIALALTAPLLAAIALLIKFDSPGPVFYRAPRVGKKGRRFFCWKFRTMTTDADKQKEHLRAQNEREGPFFKIAGDPRITRVGHWLRRYSLDELPQLFNVLKGEMSMVGPRPHPLDDCARYRLQDLRRLDVVPGITGLWQVTARHDPSFERNMALDLEYIEHWNLAMDLRILCRTAWVVMQGSGA